MTKRRPARLFVAGEPLRHYLAWLTAALTFVAGLAVAGLLLIDDAVASWQRRLAGAVIVQIAAGETPAAEDQRVEAALAAIRATPGVATATAVPPAAVRRLLSPWIADGNAIAELPLPRLIDVTLESGVGFDADQLRRQVQMAVAEATVDDHGRWLGGAVGLLRRIEATGLAALAALALALCASVAVTTRGGLFAHRETVEVLHLIGADDGFIARHFAARAVVLVLAGGIPGVALAVAGVESLAPFAAEFRQGLFAEVRLGSPYWLAVLGLPLATAAMAMLTARGTVMWSLRRMR
jgi:cell division transport system permease protein